MFITENTNFTRTCASLSHIFQKCSIKSLCKRSIKVIFGLATYLHNSIVRSNRENSFLILCRYSISRRFSITVPVTVTFVKFKTGVQILCVQLVHILLVLLHHQMPLHLQCWTHLSPYKDLVKIKIFVPPGIEKSVGKSVHFWTLCALEVARRL